MGMYRGGLIMHPWGRPGLGQMRTECTAQGPRPCGFREHFCLASSGGWGGGGRSGLGCQVILSHICFSQMFLGGDRGSYGKVWGGGGGVTSEHTEEPRSPGFHPGTTSVSLCDAGSKWSLRPLRLHSGLSGHQLLKAEGEKAGGEEMERILSS